MASSLISSSHHIDFDSVFGIDDAGLVQMFESLIATGLKNFLGCPAVFYESALIEFFENSSVRDGMVVRTIKGKAVEISEEVFAATFELPIEGLTDFSEVPKDLVFDARSLFSISKEQVSISCLKKEMKIDYRLLSDILAKTIYVKAGSFDAVTRERFLLMTAITFDVKVNWSRLLFDVLKEMVSPGSRHAKGYAIQICVLLKNIPGLELGESRAFPLPRVLNEKTVHRYVVINEKVGGEEITDSPKLKKTPAKKAVSLKRPAVDTAVAPVVKKKRTTKGKPVAMETVAVAQEAVPLQIFEDTADAPVEQTPVPKIKIQKRKRRLVLETDDEINVEKQPAIENMDEQVGGPADDSIDEGTVIGNVANVDDPKSSEKEPVDEPVAGQQEVVPVVEASTDDPDTIIEQVLNQLDSVATTDGKDQPAETAEERQWFDLPYEDLMAQLDAERPVVTASDTDEEMEQVDGFTEINTAERTVGTDADAETMDFGTGVRDQQVDDKGKEPLKKKDPIKGRPHLEHYSLICADIDLLVKLRTQVIDEIDQFFNSFSLKKLATINIEDMTKKEEQVLYWGESESTLSSSSTEKAIAMISDLHLFVLEELKEQAIAHGLTRTKTCCSKIFEGHTRDCGAVITRNNTSTQSKCWIQTMIRVDGVWVVEPCADHWVKIPRPVVLNEVPLQCSYVDTLPTVISQPVFRLQFIQQFAYSGIRNFVGSIASERTALRSVQSSFVSSVVHNVQTEGSPILASQNLVSATPRVQLLDGHPLSASTSEDSALNFDEIDTAATSTSLPAASIPKITEALSQLRASIEQISERDDGAKHNDTLLLHLHDFERNFTARFDAQDRVLGVLRKDSNDQRMLMSLDLKSSHKQLSTKIATNALDVVDVRRVVREHHQELNAKITSLDEQVAANRNDLLEFSAQAQQTLKIITDQLSELVAYINLGGNDKKGEVGSSRGPQPPPDDQNRGSGNMGGGGDTDRSIIERLISADRQRQRERSRGPSSGSYNKRRY
ncbi:hypothetical protein F511_16930 [Dorcoceras hygrometricum]|uniref:Dystroglycan-like n=1 Tax=Dorcoceras hygrometricum TaxID=472368 RepID=A0A2Z7BXI5_9LAMI|nr:hypothetical protein F511_16930 [Dorcoceras hygrometricum]